jgi:soluble lytic murein transglycosylase-like protein
MRLILLFLLAGSAYAGEYAVLANGSRLHIDRHEVVEGKVRLHTGTGYVELNPDQIQAFDIESQPIQVPEVPVPQSKPQAVKAEAPVTPGELADRAADKYGLPRSLVRSVMAAESGFQPNAVSAKGAIGLMQLMPRTARDLGVNPQDPAQNVDAGTRYLRDLLEKYNYGLWHALAAYNAGPGAVDRYKGLPPYRETLNYVKRIDRSFKEGAGSAPPADAKQGSRGATQ